MNKQNRKQGRIFLLCVFILITAVSLIIFLTNPARRSLLMGPGENPEKMSTFHKEDKKSGKPYTNSDITRKIKEKPVGKDLSFEENPLPEAEEGYSKPEIDFAKLKIVIGKDISRFPGTVGFILFYPATGDKIEINPNEEFESASLVKLPIMVEFYNAVERGDIKPGMEMELKESHKVGGSGILKNKPAGSRWTIKQLVELMITESDNTATDMLIDLLGMKAVEKTAGELGMKKTTLRRKIFAFEEIDRGSDNYTTPEDMFILLKAIYEGEKQSKENCIEMLAMLKKQKRNSMLPMLLPKEAVCAHKTGSLLGILHDVGIIYPSRGNPYILVLTGKNVTDEKLGESVFAEISKKVYFTLNPAR